MFWICDFYLSVWTSNIDKGTTELSEVRNNFLCNSQKFVKIHISVVSIVDIDEHPFFENDGWVAAKDLRQGDSQFAEIKSKFIFYSEICKR